MRICDDLEFVTWTPDFSSSGQASPRWTRVSSGGLQLANSVEWVDWSSNPVQVILCEACGYADCNPGNYVHISRLGDLIVWSAPHIDESDDWEVSQYTPSAAVRRYGAVGLREVEWQRLRALDQAVPPSSLLTQATRRVLADAWRLSVTGPARVDKLAALIPQIREQLLASDSFEPEAAIAILEPLVRWLGEAPDEPIAGAICQADSVHAQVETLYFDGPREHDWPAFALVGSSPALALSGELVFIAEGAA